MASSSKIRIKPPQAASPLPKIVLKKRGTTVDDDLDPSDLTPPGDDDAMDQDDDDDDDEAANMDEDGNDGPDDDGPDEVTDADLLAAAVAAPVYTPRARGRPRGSGAGRTRGPSGRPRGRPRGSRARGGPTRGRPVVWRPNSNERDSPPPLDDDSPTSTPAAWEEPVDATSGKPIRRIKGQVYFVENDELVTDNDDVGDTKIDQFGVLQGGRQFKAVTFTIPTRAEPRRHFMLAIDAARTSGYRDSLYFFRRNPLILKLNMTQAEKEALIDGGVLSPHLRSRSVTLVAARAAFKVQGAKMIKDGRWVVDDYYEVQARADCLAKGLVPGEPVGDLPDPQGYGQPPAAADAKARDKPAGFQGSIYKSGGPTTFFGGSGLGVFAADGEPAPGRARRPTADVLKAWDALGERWMAETAEAVADTNESIKKMRMDALQAYRTAEDAEGSGGGAEEPPLGVYEPHTGLVLYRASSQPAKVAWERVPPGMSTFKGATGGTKAGGQAWALARVDYVMETTSARAEADKFAAERHREVQEALAAEAAEAAEAAARRPVPA